MTLGLDYDATYTLDPKFWDEFIKLAHAHKHKVVCVTFRHPKQGAPGLEGVIDICHVESEKCQPADDQGYYVDVWIDDSPHLIGILK